MVNHVMKKVVCSASINGVVAFLVVYFVKVFHDKLNIYTFFDYIESDTKQFVLHFLILFLAFLSTLRFQYKILEKLKRDYPQLLTIIKYVTIIMVSWAASFAVNYFFQYFQHLKDPVLTVTWIEENAKIFRAGVIYLFLIFLFTFSLLGNLYFSTLFTSAFLLLIGYVHYNKLNLRVEPLYPFDYKQIGQLKEVILMIKEYVSLTQIIGIGGLFVFLIILVLYFPKIKIPLRVRGIFIIIGLLLIYSYTYFPNTFLKSWVENQGVTIVKWNQIDNYEVNGFLFGFISNFHNATFEKPKGYSKQKVVETAQKYVKMAESQSTGDWSDSNPNIIFLMSESFWDPSNLKVEFSEDPIPNLRKLMEQYTSGKVLSPVFGGATANVEFEALTGFSTAFLKSGAVPYQDFIDNKSFMPTLVSDLETKGYKSIALHPFNKSFYKRDIVYERFGIDYFFDEETMSHNERTPGGIISDQALTDEIIDNVKNQKKPLFIHAVSMQNHMPYNLGAYEENTIKIKGLSPESTNTVETYTEGIKRSDEALQSLINQLEQLNEPTIVVFWGDHLPILGSDRAIYQEAHYGSTNEDVNIKMFHETPLLIFTTFESNRIELNSISPFYLSPIVYQLAKMESPAYFSLLNQLIKEAPVYQENITIGSNQLPIHKLSKEQKELIDDFRMIQYDLSIGKQYSLELMYKNY